jgi:SAM-dependent methyltransferase
VSDNLVRDIHDVVAGSEDLVEASVRPAGTTQRELRAMQRDVLRKLWLRAGTSVVEIGCGVGLLGVPVAERAAHYVGLDFAPRAVQVANERLQAAGVGGHAQVLCLDVLDVAAEELSRLGRFDRVLVYAVFHYVRSEQEAVCLLQRIADLLAPGGRALIGNVPLEDLSVDWVASEQAPRGPLERLLSAGGWTAAPRIAVPLTAGWKARRTLEAIIKAGKRRQVKVFTSAGLPANYTLALSTATVERWLRGLDGDLTYSWMLPDPGVPLASARADLVIVRH